MKKIYAFILALTVLLTFSPLQAKAQTENNVRRNNKIVVAKDEVVNDDYFASGENVTISGTINGDLFILAGKAYIDGTINGDVLVASGQVTIDGPVTGNIRAAGGDVILSSDVGGNVTLAGGNILVDDRANIAGSLNGAFGNARILSPVGKSMHIAGGQVTLGNEVGHNVKAAVGKLSLVNGAHVKGDLLYASDEEIDISGGAIVDGSMIKKVLPEQIQRDTEKKNSGKAFLGIMGFGALFWMINAFILGALLLGMAPKYSSQILETITKRFWKSLLVGFVASLVIPVAALIFLVTVFGIPIALITMAGFVLVMAFGKIMFSFYLGIKMQNMLKVTKNKYVALLIGLLVFSIIGWIPVIGWLISIVGTLTGAGAILTAKKELYTTLKSKKLL